MNIQFASDLHLEFPQNQEYFWSNPLRPEGDILLLAGDIIPFERIEQHRDFFKYCSDHFSKTFWIPGNHEYYYSKLENRTGHFLEEIECNFYLTNNTQLHHGNTLIVLSTLWTPIPEDKAWYIQNGLNDYRLINDKGKLFSCMRSSELFEENFKFIKDAVLANSLEKCVIVTHHVPTFDHYPEEYMGSTLNEAFAVDLNQFILSSKIDYWIYGHHHRNTPDFSIGKTKMVTNQLGYVSQREHEGFKIDRLIST